MSEPLDINAAIIAASLEFSRALRSRPRDQQRIDTARAALDELMVQRDASA